ncbi:MAG: hypothetical protein K1X51_03030 [Rhodospirillaceae bacterium]|nr:hypothetical protein [Rhodospirillaceae bacterium]
MGTVKPDGKKLIELRNRKGFSTRKELLARNPEIALRTLERAERGEPIRARSLNAIAQALKVPEAEVTLPAGGSHESEGRVPAPSKVLRLVAIPRAAMLIDRATEATLPRIEVECDFDLNEKTANEISELIESVGEVRQSKRDEDNLSDIRLASGRVKMMGKIGERFSTLAASGIHIFAGLYPRRRSDFRHPDPYGEMREVWFIETDMILLVVFSKSDQRDIAWPINEGLSIPEAINFLKRRKEVGEKVDDSWLEWYDDVIPF